MKHGKFSATFISRNFFPDYFPNKLRVINTGLCYDWAYYAYRLFPTVQLWSDYSHAWVQLGRRHYDSEVFRGTPDYRLLPCNRVCGLVDPKPMPVETFKEHWNHNGGRRPEHWDIMLEAKLEKVTGNKYRQYSPILA